MDIKQSLEVVSRTGKYVAGYRKTLHLCLNKRAELVIVSEKAKPEHLQALEYASKISGVPILKVGLSPSDIGVALRKNFAVASLAILDAGSADFGELQGEGYGE
ncbi:hypothetical protein HRbin01_01649 [archaeon HR01]|nr:hypothetical protein HRbin01_01649 [archaeon HR01]